MTKSQQPSGLVDGVSLHRDLAVLAALWALALAVTLPFLDWMRPPFEDAAMLMRYADHLARGHGIVWNIGEAPLDGATDFLFLLAVALLRYLGLELEPAVRVLGLAAHLSTMGVLYLGGARMLHASRLYAGLAAFYVGVGPGLKYVTACFGTPFFAMFAAATWLFVNRIRLGDRSIGVSAAFAVLALALGLTRPDGVFLAGFMLLALVWATGLRAATRPVLAFLLVFAVFGGAYFAWRWGYFGHPLPNPFYKKGGGALYPTSLVTSLQNGGILLLPLLPAYFLGLLRRSWMRETAFHAVPLVLFLGIWLLLSNEMNYLMRFQYAVMPMAALSWAMLMSRQTDVDPHAAASPGWRDLRKRKGLLPAYLLLLAIYPGVVFNAMRREVGHRDGRRNVALELRELRDRGYTIATTEAGLLPLYSEWKAIDTWGLNDSWIAHNRGITSAYLERKRPEVIMFHAYFSPGIEPAGAGAWYQMIVTLHRFAESGSYELAAVYGRQPRDTHYYYVRRGLPETEELLRRIRSVAYGWYIDGKPCGNFAP